MAAKITLSPEQVPEVRHPLPVMRLESAVLAPDTTIRDFVKQVAPQAEFKNMGQTGLLAAHDGERLVSYMNPTTGETKIFPSMEGLKPGKGIAERAYEVARRLAADESLFPKDGTEVVPLKPRTLVGTNHVRGQRGTDANEYLAFVRLQRRVDGLPVFGPGARAMVAVDADGLVRGFSHRFRKAGPAMDPVAPVHRTQIAERMREHLARTMSHAGIKLDKVTTGYYDGGGGVLQPVFRFDASILAPQRVEGRRGIANSHVFGYLSVGAAPEALPELNTLRGTPPAYAPSRAHADAPATAAMAGDPTVGRYVVRNDSVEWVNSANEFLGGLQLANFFGSPIPFSNSQYFWAEPREYLSEKDSFINSVNVALTESHGNWDLFSTRDNQDDIVDLSSIPAGGYGGPGHSLAYWIIHSCEVIPTQTDESTSFDVWWNIFQGLHATVGYRTEMWIDDDVTGPFGFAIGLGAPVIGAWLNEVSTNDSYDDGDTYFDTNRNITEPMGRASAIAVTGHGGDTVNNLGSLGPASNLTEWWFNN